MYMKIDELFTTSEMDVREAATAPETETVGGVPVVYDAPSGLDNIMGVLCFTFENRKMARQYIPELVEIIETYLLPGIYDGMVCNMYSFHTGCNLCMRLQSERIRPERMLLLMASLTNVSNSKTRVSVDMRNSSRHIHNELLIAKYMYTMKNFFFSAKDCENLSSVLKELGFFGDMSDGDAYCYVSDINSKLDKIKNGEYERR